jgi:hypothetical protein
MATSGVRLNWKFWGAANAPDARKQHKNTSAHFFMDHFLLEMWLSGARADPERSPASLKFSRNYTSTALKKKGSVRAPVNQRSIFFMLYSMQREPNPSKR